MEAEPDARDPASIPAKLPGHVGIIMDGNGRWAGEQGLPREAGHERGADAVRTVVRASRKLGLGALTLFAFSAQNWDRPAEEVFHLMQLLRRYLLEEREEILDTGIRLVTVGETQRLPDYVREPLEALIAESAGNREMTLCLALSYGGRETIARAVREICRKVAAQELAPDDVSTDVVAAHLPSSRLLPPLDLLVRTSGEFRVSNFFLWEVAYAELYFTPKMWPEFGRDDLLEALAEYARRERRFGRTSAQLHSAAFDEASDSDPRAAIVAGGDRGRSGGEPG
jgi:undecaprenyl diphosphate synthase